MEWMHSMQKAINYIEENLLENIDRESVAKSVYSSSANFQRIFSVIAGIAISDYIRFRRLTLAGRELSMQNARVIDVALRYGYDTPESFTKAFQRFHGITPSAARKQKYALKCFDPLIIQIDIKGGFNMSRRLIPNIPLITLSSDDLSYLTSFVGALYGVFKGVGEEYDNSELLACSGLGNRLCWTAGKWVFGNEDIENCNSYPFELQGRLLNAYGWRADRVAIDRDGNGNILNTTKEKIRQDFIDSINSGLPVLAQGITDDGCKHDYDVFYGYEEDGCKIIGWDYYQKDNQPFIRDNWESELASYVMLTGKSGPESERSRILSAFQTIAGHARQGELNGKLLGIAAWEALLDQLEHDDFSKCTVHPENDAAFDENAAKSLEHRFIIYCDALCQINQRGSILPYYRSLIAKFPEWADDLGAAIEAWDSCASYGGYLWSQGLSFDEQGFQKFGDPRVRKALADEGRRAMQKDIEAIGHIEKILQKEGL